MSRKSGNIKVESGEMGELRKLREMGRWGDGEMGEKSTHYSLLITHYFVFYSFSWVTAVEKNRGTTKSQSSQRKVSQG
ncbi:MAG: hypothetical protein F6J86_03790 [Symploca sp. SIO1B1]|nr:hypothetical protein [Symploca sp. SIO1B1]